MVQHRQRSRFEGVALGWMIVPILPILPLMAVGCQDPKPGDENADETGGTEVGDGDGDTGDGDTGVPDNGIPLALESVRFNKTGKFLLLHFSEPMAPVDAVDPSDFRISLALTTRQVEYGKLYADSVYFDPLYYLGSYQYNYDPGFLVVEAVGNGNQPNDIVLRFTTAMDAQACESFSQLEANLAEQSQDPTFEGKAALFTHYSPGAIHLESLDGELLTAMGAAWVETDEIFMDLPDEWSWPHLVPQLPIPCDVEPEPPSP